MLIRIAATPAFMPALMPVSAHAQLRGGLKFPADFGAHPEARTEWWYVTGSLQSGVRQWGFQVTFFRSSTGIEAAAGGRFNPTQLLFAHAALTDLEGKRLRHDQRIARSGFDIAQAALDDARVRLRDWQLVRTGAGDASRYAVRGLGSARAAQAGGAQHQPASLHHQSSFTASAASRLAAARPAIQAVSVPATSVAAHRIASRVHGSSNSMVQ